MSWASFCTVLGWDPVTASFGLREELDRGSPRVSPTVTEQCRGGDDAGADAAAELLAHPVGDRPRAAVGLEALEVEPEPFRPGPQVRVLEPALVVEQRVVHRPERAL